MKQKNYKWIFIIAAAAIAGSIFYIATKDISPISRHIENKVEINFKN